MANIFQDIWDNIVNFFTGTKFDDGSSSTDPLGPDIINQITGNSDTPGSSTYLYGLSAEQRKIVEDFIAKGDYLGLQGYLAQNSLSLGPDFEKWLDNMISQQNTQAQWEYEKELRDSQILSSASQYSSLGMNPAAMLSGLASSNSLNTAENVKSSVSLQKAQQKLEMTKAVLSMVSSMGAAGIHGASLGLARGAASKMASRAATSMSASMADLERENESYKQAMYRLAAVI